MMNQENVVKATITVTDEQRNRKPGKKKQKQKTQSRTELNVKDGVDPFISSLIKVFYYYCYHEYH